MATSTQNIKITGYSHIPNYERLDASQTFITIDRNFGTPTSRLIVGKFLNKTQLVKVLQDEYLYDDVEIAKNALADIEAWDINLNPKKKEKEETKEPVK